MTVEEYFELEEQSEIRHEYFNGEMYAMADDSLNHNEIVSNIRAAFSSFFRPRGCRAFAETIKLKASDIYYAYPDVMVTCAPSDVSGTYIVEHPSILVGVVSKTSEHIDRVFKLKEYKRIASLKYYLLVAQNDYGVELYSRLEQTDLWTYHTFHNPTDNVRLDAFDFQMSLDAIYENIEFVPEE
ncbi:Endonuclease, Uma2 family (restriction endonuclease fold) [Dyadobacter soli]|uniref:Endonuclease, Uma2 family (Restriction endonuclease fold) n=1 Tax=Dyadobacter soli TaxID=659014 RepID=A0A1G7YNN7_9BACT|nr:Uma2 family endonuclease [Dyadobacter soli]SDG97839.1 Endonuclease, Uma2 family (restriction endonuclease fold) [Dyadobacter soli]